ncbi:Hypothetical predicted protein [Mytilus galloprovincialis]|uniref:Mab-21-like HhH/H2TH-like domain-containing protein n=1 Tax=Mytilus galloprovincialis TaxID=29158 RepID=A0A8B6E1P5_MYTGA|nr:Hypothetical predicted protein [Mytilus galloprovincialis]
MLRLMNTVCDNLSSDDNKVIITSGSFGEGLEMRGSDIDVMFVTKNINVHDKITPITFDPTKTHFSLMTDNSKPGFAMLRLISSPYPRMRNICEQFRGDKYLSNVLFKQNFLNEISPVVHGPCLSDINGHMDFANCLHSKYWVTSASRWPMRSSDTWPNEITKPTIINHGVLFVPIGAKGSPNEELEWRMSFSVGEKLLIYTFSHSQLLCYAVMKILLKDIINSDSRCKNVLCSYYIKTSYFLDIRRITTSVWTPENLIPCFMRCFSRLIYCVQYQVCPHYFIPENNLFENKIEGMDRDNLMETLRVLFSYGWRCILFSKQISHFPVLSCKFLNDKSVLCYEDINKLLKSNICVNVTSMRSKHNEFVRVVHNIITCNSKKLKYMHAYFLSVVCNKRCQSVYLSRTVSNKSQYRQYNMCLSYLLMNINHDAVSGWLMTASLFYKTNQYDKSLIIILYALSKCTLDKLFYRKELSVTQKRQVKSLLVQKKTVLHLLKFVLVDSVFFASPTFIPTELIMEGSGFEIPPVVYAHCLSFLCHNHQQNMRECRNSLRDLQLTITEDYFIGEDESLKSSSYYCLGTALQLMGDKVSAKQAFTETVKLLSRYPYAIKRLKRLL